MPAPIILTKHAAERYRERVRDIPAEDIAAELDTPAIRFAIGQPCRCAVILPAGQRVIIKDGTIITVLPKDSNGLY